MSVASVTNKTLQLAELVISNEKFTGATGYVASTSTFSSSVNSTSLAASSITSFGNISAATFTTTNAGTSTFDDITAVGTVTVETGISSPVYSGGIGKFVGSEAVNIGPSGGTLAISVTIPNFIGTAASAYVITYNNLSILPLILSCAFSAPNGTGTIVNVTMSNASATTSITETIDYSIIAMN